MRLISLALCTSSLKYILFALYPIFVEQESFIFVCFSANHPNSTFDVVVSGILQPSPSSHGPDILGEICRVLKPNGKFYIGEVITATSDEGKEQSIAKLNSTLKFSGFINIGAVRTMSILIILRF